MIEPTLRPASAHDSDFCFKLHEAAMGEVVMTIWEWDPVVQRHYHDRWFVPDHLQIVVAQGQDIGALAVDRNPGELYLGRIEILPAWQGRGIGRWLIRQLADEARHDRKSLTLDVLVANTRAVMLYRELGFREVMRHGENSLKIRMQLEFE